MPDIDQLDQTPEWWCGACPDPDECTATSTCTFRTEQQARHRQVDALIAAARASTRDRLIAELARTDELLAYCDQAASHPAVAECRQLLLEHRHAVEALVALVDAPDEEWSRMLAAADQAMGQSRQAIIALADVIGTARRTDG
jgi:hypothetical protein